jgi:hypothetical protein
VSRGDKQQKLIRGGIKKMEQTKTKQGNVCAKWEITRKELQEAVDELCAKGVGKGCYQNTNALLAALELLSSGDIEEEQK